MGRRFAAKRKQLKLTQAELGERCDFTPQYISKVETGQSTPSIQGIMKICKALKVTPNFALLGIEESAESEEYLDAAHKLKMCNPTQLRKVSKYIDLELAEE